MAPSKSFRTYSRGHNSSKSCVEAFDILFAKNLTERKLHGKIKKGKSKIQIKELPKKITTQVKSVLSDESSLHVYVNDTFDNVFKDPQKKSGFPRDMSIKIIANNTSTSLIKHFNRSNYFSPMLSKLRSHKSQNSDLTTTNSWFKQSTLPGERITNELEIEKVSFNHRKANKSSRKASKHNSSRESPILLRSRVKLPEIKVTEASSSKPDQNVSKILKESSECQKINNESSIQDLNLSFNPIFTNSVREKILIHSSTPLVSNKATRLIKQPISPIRTVDDEIKSCIFESLREIRSWEDTLPRIENKLHKTNSLSKIEDFKGFEKQEISGQHQLDIIRNNFVTVRGRPLNMMKNDTDKNKTSTEKAKSFSLEDFELFYNKFKTRSFKLEDFERFQNSLSLNNGKVEKFTQSQVNKLKSISVKDFESFFELYRTKVSLNQEHFLDNSQRSRNFVTNRKHRLSLSKNTLSLSKKYQKLDQKFNLKTLVVVLDNILVNNSKAKLRKNGSLGKSGMMNSIVLRQPVVNLTRLSLNSLNKFKAKDRLIYNGYRACRKFSSNWNPKRVSRKIGHLSDLSAGSDRFMNSDIISLGHLIINLTRMPVEEEKSSTKITEIEDLSDTERRMIGSVREDMRVTRSSEKSKANEFRKTSNAERENEKTRASTTFKFRPSQINTKKSDFCSTVENESLTSAASKYSLNSHQKGRNSLETTNTEFKAGECADGTYLDNEEQGIQMILHSVSSIKKPNRSIREKQYVAKILFDSVSDTEMELRHSNNSFLKEMSQSLRSISQENLHYCTANASKSLSCSDKRSSLKHSKVLHSPPPATISRLSDPSPEDVSCEINSRLANTNLSVGDTPYRIVDLSSSILSNNENDENVLNPVVKDVIVDLTLNTWNLNSEKSECGSFSRKSTNVSGQNLNNLHIDLTKGISLNLNTSTPKLSVSMRKSQNNNEKTPHSHGIKKSLRFDLQNSHRTNTSISSDDFIDSSLNITNGTVFKAPMGLNKFKQKVLNLKAGKLWRRSLLVHKRESFIDLTQDLNQGSRNTLSRNSTLQNSLRPSDSSWRRQSIKIVPLCDPRFSRRRTVLQTYAQTNLSTVLDDSIPNIASETPTKTKLSLEKSLPLVTAKEIVLKRCGYTEPQPFEKLYPKSLLKDCKKIGEGVYGEVFLYSNPSGDTTVMKVIPIEGDKIVNGERQKKFDEILSEIVIASELSALRKTTTNQTYAFSEVQRICCVQGKYPKSLLDLWEAYDIVKGSENDSPSIFDDDQLYIVLDLANGGRDLEAFVFSSAAQAVSMFKQVSCALAVAEQNLQFEHRDLHWGNVLLKAVDKNKKVTCKHKGKIIENATQGVEVTIIDFTLSRIAHDGVVIFNDLGQDPDLFVAEGDYQFDIYRLMRDRNLNDWQKFEPYTNILWLHYILKKSITALRYKNTKTKIHRRNIDCLKDYESEILKFKSVSEFVNEYF